MEDQEAGHEHDRGHDDRSAHALGAVQDRLLRGVPRRPHPPVGHQVVHGVVDGDAQGDAADQAGRDRERGRGRGLALPVFLLCTTLPNCASELLGDAVPLGVRFAVGIQGLRGLYLRPKSLETAGTNPR